METIHFKLIGMKNLIIIEAPTNLGLKQLTPESEPGVRKLPGWLKANGLYQKLSPQKVVRVEAPLYSMKLDYESGVRNADEIINYSVQLADEIQHSLKDEYFPIVVGGDCSILIGIMLALKQMGKYALFFLDGHTDFMLPELSQTSGAAGMDLAIVTGHGNNKLTNMKNQKPYVVEEHVWCVGNREYNEEYEKPIKQSAISYYDLNKLRTVSFEKCIDSFIKMINRQKLNGFWIHLDVDVLNDEIMPAVDSRTKDGLNYMELKEILQPLLLHPKNMGIDITILDPDLDPTAKYTKPFISSFSELLNLKTKIFRKK